MQPILHIGTRSGVEMVTLMVGSFVTGIDGVTYQIDQAEDGTVSLVEVDVEA